MVSTASRPPAALTAPEINMAVRKPWASVALCSAAAPVNGQTTNTSANTQLRVPYVGFSPAGMTVARIPALAYPV